MALIRKEDLPKVGYQGMNFVHEKELDILNELYDSLKSGSSLEEIDKLFEAFIRDVEEHFAYEEDLMRKAYFFAYDCHSGEHRRVLEELYNLRKKWRKEKNPEILIDYFENTFKPWIEEHILTMDTVTAGWLLRVMGGIPV
ncbi:hemerythrin [Balnearium lithotrophicum]|uniref:Hemerythrin n=1 Tax=Balnearium lithotrophicum TaxID=223788 RepID=A0A521E4K8_9BACT|nr:hemerythrin family protein [Balnearium lithotrophicum]SMO78894.1 hemerythrin [Balnearium lithotrophicum]